MLQEGIWDKAPPRNHDLSSSCCAGAAVLMLQGRASWRVRVVGLSTGGESAEDLAPTISNLLAYDGVYAIH